MKLKFPDFLLNTDIKVIETIHTESGIEEVMMVDSKCIYNEKIKQILNAQRELVSLSGMCILKGNVDIKPGDIAVLEGQQKTVYSVNKPKNPNGSVFSTEVYFI